VYKLIEKNVYDAFSCDDGNERYKLYEDFQNVIGISVKLADATTKGEAEKYLSEIEDWENVMPLSLKNALLLKADFPDELYYLPLSRISVVSNALSSAAEEITDALTEYYCTEEKLKSIFYVSFFFNVLLTLLFNEAVSLTAQSKRKIINTFATVSEIYLKSYYNEKLLEDEAGVTLLQPLHLFAWYLVKGIKQKESNPLECVKILREALHRIPQAGSIVEFITEEIRAQEEKKEQEQIKNVSPELLTMAEQLKAMLSAFSPDDPQLLAIKQSPLYKQVAFLIEE
ncbi:MAG: hypothetical protein IKC01_00780, partial [Clostridia bacterium]|nr:hypothetical protein [Clostridia bacterium]